MNHDMMDDMAEHAQTNCRRPGALLTEAELDAAIAWKLEPLEKQS